MKNNKVLPALLALGLTTGATVVPAFAEENKPSGSTSSEGIELSKTATLEDDGTYTLNLEAYATGEVKTSTTTDEKGVPCDIVLVLDESGSMADKISTGTKVTYTKRENGKPSNLRGKYFLYNGEYYQIKTEIETEGSGFSKKTYYRVYFEVDGNKYYLTKDGDITEFQPVRTKNETYYFTYYERTETAQTDSKKNILKKAVSQFIENVSTDSKTNNADHKIAIVGFAGTVSESDGSRIIKNLNSVNDENGNLKDTFKNLSLNSEGGTWAEHGLAKANTILAERTEKTFTNLKGEQQDRKQIVIFFTDGIPGDGRKNYFGMFSDNALNSANAAIGNSNTLKTNGATVYSVAVLDGADPNGDYLNYSTLNAQKNAFLHLVSSNYDKKNPTPTMNTAKNGTAKDRDGYYVAASDEESLKKIFELLSQTVNSSTSTSNTTLTSEAVLKDVISDEFSLPESAASVNAYTVAYAGKDSEGNRTWDESSKTKIDATVDKKSKTVSVTGFDYSNNYVVDASNNLPTSGKKLVLEIKGVTANESAVTGDVVHTNAPTSGIYKDSETANMVAAFPQPETILTKKAYVMDYAASKNVFSRDWKQNSISSLNGNMKSSVKNNPVLKYGTVNKTDNTVTYSPSKTSWDGYDSIYSFGSTNDETVTAVNTNGNLWSKVSFIPANNVYFEDDFVSTNDGKVGIVYTGEWNVANDDKEQADIIQNDGNSDVHGWIDEISGNTGFTGGSAHGSGKKGATAEFTFTGDGLDIYSRTNANTGRTNVKIYKDDGTLISGKTIDHTAQNGDYYHLPTYRWKGEYGTYKIKIEVRADAKPGKDCTYYLDGIRVYNPLGNQLDDTVKDAYGTEVNAQFVTIRDQILIGKDNEPVNRDAAEQAAYYIDKDAGSTTDLAIYKDHGPKSEVYIAPGHKLVLNVGTDPDAKYAIGLKTPISTAQAAVSNRDKKSILQINSATDMFYEVMPDSEGNIIIQNTEVAGDSFLSVTKLKKTNSADTTIYRARSANQALAVASDFDNRNVVDYNGVVSDTENDIDDSPVEDVIETFETEDNNVDVIISDQPEEDEKEEKKSFFETIFSGFRSIFGTK